jgi:hypothetical protein
MALFCFLLAVIGGGVVADLVLENTAGGEVSVLNQTVTGHAEGTLLALVAGLGLVVGLLLVASLGLTKTRRARRKQLRSSGAGVQQHAATPDGEQTDQAKELFGLRQSGGERGEPVRLADLGGERWAGRPDGCRVTPEPTNHDPQPRHDQAWRAVHLRDDPYPWFQPSRERVGQLPHQGRP